jgi:putative restriction endonuclease
MMNKSDLNIRLAAFEWIKIQSDFYEDGIPRKILEEGFEYDGYKISLVGAQGIWKPKRMALPISITTIKDGPYEDSWSGDRFLKYSYRGNDPLNYANVWLREIMKDQIPMIYLLSVHKGYYLAEWPVYIVGDNIPGLSFTVDMKEGQTLQAPLLSTDGDAGYYQGIEKNYKTSQILVRLHQKTFRERVLQAYSCQCSLCRLKHRELLDAAHIISDKEDHGDPIVTNGISLCKIHHAAFDKNIIGITPDYSIQVRQDILNETDGPMLKFGIQELNGKEIILPERKEFYPDQKRLEERFERFLKAG